MFDFPERLRGSKDAHREERVQLGVFWIATVVLSMAYGLAAHKFDWPPSGLFDVAYRQAQLLLVDDVEELPQNEAETKPDSLEFLKERRYERSGVRVERPGEIQPGLTLLTTRWKEEGKWRAGLRLIDRQGDVLHSWRVYPDRIFDPGHHRRKLRELPLAPIHGTYLFPGSGHVLVNVEYAGVVRLDACGTPLRGIAGGNHHSIHRDDDGSFWTPALTHGRKPRTSEYPDGFPDINRNIYHGMVMNFGPADSVRATINMLNVLYDNDLGHYIVETGQHRLVDVLHINDVEPLPEALAGEYPLFDAGDLAISIRNLHLVLVMDPETRDVKWHKQGGMLFQHDPDFIGDGWIGIFDNNRDESLPEEQRERSRIIAVQPHTDSVRTLFPTPESEPLYTGRKGKWQLLENGNMLLTESFAGRVVEVNPEGETVWEWIASPYTEELVPDVSKAHRYSLSREEVAQWRCNQLSP